MRIALSGDMEAIAGISDVRETFGWCREYWDTGRQAYTGDVVAAVQGLLDAGADEVIVLDHHGAGAPWNILIEQLPDGARAESVNVFDLPRHDIDGLLLVGYHPPAGIDGFVPHTYVPNVRLFVDGVEIGEAHGRAWAANVPLLGITGHESLRPTLGALSDAPFLAVQTGTDRLHATLTFTDVAERTEVIRSFARDCLRGISEAPHPRPPANFAFEGRVSSAEPVALQLADWTDAQEPIAAAWVLGWRLSCTCSGPWTGAHQRRSRHRIRQHRTASPSSCWTRCCAEPEPVAGAPMIGESANTALKPRRKAECQPLACSGCGSQPYRSPAQF